MSKPFIHSSSFVDKSAKIMEGVKIWHFCNIMPDSTIGRNCVLGQNVFVGQNVLIGDNCKIQNNISIYDGVEIEDDVFCGPSAVFTNVRFPRSYIDQKNKFQKTILKKGCTIGANATIVCGHDIGQYAFIGAGAVVTKEIPDYALVIGNPAKQVGWMSEYGHKLIFNEQNEATCPESNEKYKIDNNKVFKIK